MKGQRNEDIQRKGRIKRKEEYCRIVEDDRTYVQEIIDSDPLNLELSTSKTVSKIVLTIYTFKPMWGYFCNEMKKNQNFWVLRKRKVLFMKKSSWKKGLAMLMKAQKTWSTNCELDFLEAKVF